MVNLHNFQYSVSGVGIRTSVSTELGPNAPNLQMNRMHLREYSLFFPRMVSCQNGLERKIASLFKTLDLNTCIVNADIGPPLSQSHDSIRSDGAPFAQPMGRGQPRQTRAGMQRVACSLNGPLTAVGLHQRVPASALAYTTQQGAAYGPQPRLVKSNTLTRIPAPMGYALVCLSVQLSFRTVN